MITRQKSWLLAALFVLSGIFGAKAQMYDWFMYLDLQHIESDFVPAAESNYYRHFLTIDNVDPAYMNRSLTPDLIFQGYDHFVLYRFPLLDGAEKTPVAKLTFTNNEAEVKYEITYMNQEPLPGYNLPLVTQGSLPIEYDRVNMEGLVLVDQLRVSLVEDGSAWVYYYGDEGEFDPSKIYYWTRCGYVMELEDDAAVSTNTCELPYAHQTNLFALGNYTYSEMDQDYWKPTIQAGMKNAYFECHPLDDDPVVTGYMVLRGDNTYPTDTISYLTRPGEERIFVEECTALPEYFGQEETWEIARNDTSLMVLGDYGDFMTYVPVVRVNGDDRVMQDGENTYGGLISKTGVAGIEAYVDGFAHDQNSEEPLMFKDDDGVDCVVFENHFDITLKLPDYVTYGYGPKGLTIWVKSDKIRDFYFDDDGNPVYIPKDEDDESGDYLCIWEDDIPEGYWDEELDEWVSTFTGELSIGDYENDRCGFGATCSAAEEGVTFVIRFYYEAEVPMPGKDSNPWYCVVEKQLPWKIQSIVTGVKEIGSENVVAKTYYNLQGLASDTPYEGFNIEVTRYSDGSTKSKKVIH